MPRGHDAQRATLAAEEPGAARDRDRERPVRRTEYGADGDRALPEEQAPTTEEPRPGEHVAADAVRSRDPTADEKPLGEGERVAGAEAPGSPVDLVRRGLDGEVPEPEDQSDAAGSWAELAGRRRRGRRRGARRGGGRGRGYRGRRGGRRGDDGCGPGSGHGGRRRGGGRRRARRVRVVRAVGVGSVLGRSGPATRARTPAGPAWTRPVAELRASPRPSWARAPVRDGMPGRDAGHGARVRGHGPGVQRGVPRRGGTARPQEDEAQGGEGRERAPDVPPAHPIHPPPRGSPPPILPS